MKLQQLLQNISDIPATQDVVVKGLSLNSKQLQAGDLFIALAGKNTDGRTYIPDAIKKGAVAVLAQANAEEAQDYHEQQIPIIYINNLDEKLDLIACRFYENPAQHFEEIIGITGTNGKTTSCYLLAQALSKLGKPCAFVGTIGIGMVPDLSKNPYTTPEPIALQKSLKALLDMGAKALTMEVSSHGLMQARVKSIPFSSAHFTNLTQDHLDYHGSMLAYGKAKQKLFEFNSLLRAVVNKDADFSQKMLQVLKKETPVAAYTLQSKMEPYPFLRPSLFYPITTKKMDLDHKGIRLQIDTPWGQGLLQSSLLGHFNASNLLGILAELCLQGYEFKKVLDALHFAMPAPGRMQRLGNSQSPQIIVDYAHTPDALENALKSAREHSTRRLWCVFGCGGDRDKEKRPLMGAIASEYADKVVITNDNPRTEEPRAIIDEILQGVKAITSEKVIVQEDRLSAIRYAIEHALPVDTIVIAGKGHEDYQIMGDTIFPFSDVQVVKTLLSED